VPRSSLPGRSALLLTGPAGCGKTFLVELLCREVLEVPAVVVDVPSLAACATVDHAIGKVLSQLLDAAGGNKARASMGVVCLDGIEKVACPVSEESAAKASPDWVLRNWRVQRALHTLLTADSVRFHYENGQERMVDPTWFPFLRNTFVACGDIEGKRAAFLPELLGAFQRKVELAPLGRAELEAILGDQVQRLRREIEPAFTLAPSREELDGIVGAALEGGLGARLLRAEVEHLVESVVHPQEEGGNR
jgi:ATP-dependent protease Clp ATPase subunit